MQELAHCECEPSAGRALLRLHAQRHVVLFSTLKVYLHSFTDSENRLFRVGKDLPAEIKTAGRSPATPSRAFFAKKSRI